ncbi:hypothetical protein AC578_3455 [Pseudocercospora eumusae]|uniref:Uncharacterized protein n=1 Tax=Pseudocercospora eumusae TaxID=321146 RepID=A0A139HR41_9PEZI|nr:hypothetical protein AC578_3455 [Pseudocercospora eumusae]
MYLTKAIISGFAALQVEVMQMGNSTAIVKSVSMPLGTDFWYNAGPNMQLGDVYLQAVDIDNSSIVSPPITCVPTWRYIGGTSIKGSEFGQGQNTSPYRILRSGIVEAVHIKCAAT